MDDDATSGACGSPKAVLAFGALTILQRLQAQEQELEGVRRAEDIEAVHRMRVALRRLRGALSAFGDCLPAAARKECAKPLRRVTRDLGEARDLDVQLEFLGRFLRNVPDSGHRVGIERLRLRLAQRRRKAQSRLLPTLDRLEEKRVADGLGRGLRAIVVDARLSGTPATCPELFRKAAQSIVARLEELLTWSPCVAQPEQAAEHHRMRIAAKKLRYTLELFEPLFAGKLKRALHAAKEAQQALGDLHDCDVWLELLPGFLERERARAAKFYGHTRPFARLAVGINFLREDRARFRAARFEEFAGRWQKALSEGVWQELNAVLLVALERQEVLSPAQATGAAREVVGGHGVLQEPR
ncbi:MAG: CHAD domain-containing protein [Planctomycetes bacterium]|nr:CHAD domain-containing protein [Planctomycetota bacterium]